MAENLSSMVSIVIPAYNAQAYIGETLLSAVMAKPQCVLVVDDGSTDQTGQIAREFSARHPVVRVLSKGNGGESSAINLGLGLVETPYVLFLSADDLIDSQLLRKAVETLEQDSSAIAVYPGWRVINHKGVALEEVINLDYSVARMVGGLTCLPGPGTVIRTASVRPGRNEELRQIPDLDQWLRLAAVGNLVHVPEVLASWRLHKTNMSHKTYGSQLSLELDALLKTVKSGFESTPLKDWDKDVWIAFHYNWHRRKAIAEARIVGSFRSIGHLALSWFYYLSAPRPRPDQVWSLLEVLGSMFPPLVWFRGLSNGSRRR